MTKKNDIYLKLLKINSLLDGEGHSLFVHNEKFIKELEKIRNELLLMQQQQKKSSDTALTLRIFDRSVAR